MQHDLLQDKLDALRWLHRQRIFAMENRKRSDLALGSFLRTQLGWERNGDATVNARAKRRAAELIKIGERVLRQQERLAEGKKGADPTAVEGYCDPDFQEWKEVVLASVAARRPFDKIEASCEKDMTNLVRELPIYEWANQIRGFGEIGLATILAEAGNLSRFSSPAKLWKRMGVGLAEDENGNFVRQGGLKSGAPAELWVRHGYNRKRRSMMYVIGDALVKGNADGEYRSLYLERKEYERERAIAAGLKVAPAARIPRNKAREYRSEGHIHLRAQRYMEKRLLKNLWIEWARLHGRIEEAAEQSVKQEGQPVLELAA